MGRERRFGVRPEDARDASKQPVPHDLAALLTQQRTAADELLNILTSIDVATI
jgi:hypothetical protein